MTAAVVNAHACAMCSMRIWPMAPHEADSSALATGLRCTVEPLSSFLTATSSPVAVSRISCATPKLPLPRSRTCLNHARVRGLTIAPDNARSRSAYSIPDAVQLRKAHVDIARLGVHVFAWSSRRSLYTNSKRCDGRLAFCPAAGHFMLVCRVNACDLRYTVTRGGVIGGAYQLTMMRVDVTEDICSAAWAGCEPAAIEQTARPWPLHGSH